MTYLSFFIFIFLSISSKADFNPSIQQVFTADKVNPIKEYLLISEDILAHTDNQITLSVKLKQFAKLGLLGQTTLKIFQQELGLDELLNPFYGAKISFTIFKDDQIIFEGSMFTNRDGQATYGLEKNVEEGSYKVVYKVYIFSDGLYKELPVYNWPSTIEIIPYNQNGIVLVNIDNTVADTNLYTFLFTNDDLYISPLPSSVETINWLDKKLGATIVYFSGRDIHFNYRTKRWLKIHGFPDGVLLASKNLDRNSKYFGLDFRLNIEEDTVFKTQLIETQFNNLNVKPFAAIGDKVSDAFAFSNNSINYSFIISNKNGSQFLNSLPPNALLFENFNGLKELSNGPIIIKKWEQIKIFFEKLLNVPIDKI